VSRDSAAWLADREPPPPVELREWLTLGEGDLPLVEALADAGRTSLEEAVRRPGRDRDAAFHLLAADAFFTYACEAAAETEDVEAALRGVLSRIGTRE